MTNDHIVLYTFLGWTGRKKMTKSLKSRTVFIYMLVSEVLLVGGILFHKSFLTEESLPNLTKAVLLT